MWGMIYSWSEEPWWLFSKASLIDPFPWRHFCFDSKIIDKKLDENIEGMFEKDVYQLPFQKTIC